MVSVVKITAEELNRRIEKAYSLLESCILCPRNCRVNRLQGEVKFCGIGKEAMVSSFAPHFGEEPPLVGFQGSGTIFFTGCNLMCLYCQNYDISHLKQGEEMTPQQVASVMLTLQRYGCHNINFVTPTHVTPQIMKAIAIAADNGLSVPLVYNCGGYESLETLKLLDGVIDIYMPDMKYSDSEVAKNLSTAPDYPEVSQEALKEMHRQVGDLTLNQEGIALRGLLIRHLVLPEGEAGTDQIMKFIATEISKNSYVNIMDQYRPCFEARHSERMNRRINNQEYQEAITIARKHGLSRGF
jgi:putative pyruvate formate lyase activating enzyme